MSTRSYRQRVKSLGAPTIEYDTQRRTFYYYLFQFFRLMDWRYSAAWMHERRFATYKLYRNGKFVGVKTVNNHAKMVKLVRGEEPFLKMVSPKQVEREPRKVERG